MLSQFVSPQCSELTGRSVERLSWVQASVPGLGWRALVMGAVLPCSDSYWGRMRPQTLSGCQTWEHKAECAQKWFQVAGTAGELHVERGARVLGLTSLLLLPCAGDPDPVLKCIVSGFFANAARLHSSGAYRYETTVHGAEVRAEPLLIDIRSPKTE